MTIENNTSEAFGSVCIRRISYDDNDNTVQYLPRFFDEALREVQSETPSIITLFNFGAINYTEKIEEICTQATKGKISELQLTQKMAEIYHKAIEGNRK